MAKRQAALGSKVKLRQVCACQCASVSVMLVAVGHKFCNICRAKNAIRSSENQYVYSTYSMVYRPPFPPPAHCHPKLVSLLFGSTYPPLLFSCAPTRPRSLCATNEPHTNNGNESEILIYGALDAIRYFQYPIYCLAACLPADKLPLSLSLSLSLSVSPLLCPVSNLLQLLWLMPILIAAAMRFMCVLMILTLMMRLPIVSLVTHKLLTGILNMPTAHKLHHRRAKLQRGFQ